MNNEELGSLFCDSSTESNSVSEHGDVDDPDWVDSSWVKLGQSDYSDGEADKLDSSIRVNKFVPKFHAEIETGLGRDRLSEYVWDQLGKEYDVDDVVDLQVYLLDELDREGKMLGKKVFEYVCDFAEEDGSPEYLQ